MHRVVSRDPAAFRQTTPFLGRLKERSLLSKRSATLKNGKTATVCAFTERRAERARRGLDMSLGRSEDWAAPSQDWCLLSATALAPPLGPGTPPLRGRSPRCAAVFFSCPVRAGAASFFHCGSIHLFSNPSPRGGARSRNRTAFRAPAFYFCACWSLRSDWPVFLGFFIFLCFLAGKRLTRNTKIFAALNENKRDTVQGCYPEVAFGGQELHCSLIVSFVRLFLSLSS